ncbi:hypothetical protein BEH94_09030 [Candidatus Altiarchaeales archaeon WOR_SM1_SCG]|nr:hypothetical protein BEH94_09030 [Candidatus Altiarchaeales archaeon WOR_SM1_SCG]
MDVLVKIPGDEMYPLAEVAKIKKRKFEEILDEVVGDWVETEAVSMYAQGKITLWKAAEIMGVSLREMIEILENKGVEIQVGRIKNIYHIQ